MGNYGPLPSLVAGASEAGARGKSSDRGRRGTLPSPLSRLSAPDFFHAAPVPHNPYVVC